MPEFNGQKRGGWRGVGLETERARFRQESAEPGQVRDLRRQSKLRFVKLGHLVFFPGKGLVEFQPWSAW